MAERTIDIHSGLSRWLESSASALAIQADKLALFEKEAIYAEYWVQNELAFHLPWSQPGCYFVDRGAGLAIPDDKPKYPDFVLRFGNASNEPVFFLELKDFLVNPERNRQNLLSAIEIMRRADRVRTLERWQTTKSASAHVFSRFSREIQNASFFYGGLGLGHHSQVPREIPDSHQWQWAVTDRWVLFLALATGMRGESFTAVLGQEETSVGLEGPGEKFSDKPLEIAMKSALECERTKRQQGVDSLLESTHDANRFRDEVEWQIVQSNLTSHEPIKHTKPWVWLAESSGGSPLTTSGLRCGIELRFSFHAKGNGL